MEDEAQTAVLVGEDGMVACAHKAACLLQDGVVGMLGPWPLGGGGGGIADAVLGTAEIVGGIGEIVASFVLHYIGAFHHTAHCLFPGLRYRDAWLECGGNGSDEVGRELAGPDAVAVGEAHEEEPCRAVIIEKHVRVDTLLVAEQGFHLVAALLPEGTGGGGGCGHIEMLVGRIIHVIGAVLVIYFRCPEPARL